MKIINSKIPFLILLILMHGCDKKLQDLYSGNKKLINNEFNLENNDSENLDDSFYLDSEELSKQKAVSLELNVSHSNTLKNYQSELMRCGTVQVRFKAKCYDELENVLFRGSGGGVRNYCESIELHINDGIVNKSIEYPVMPSYLIGKLKKDGYIFNSRVGTNDWTPNILSCLTMNSGENYILISYINEDRDLFPRNMLWDYPVALSLMGVYVDKEKQKEINNHLRDGKVSIQNQNANIVFLGE